MDMFILAANLAPHHASTPHPLCARWHGEELLPGSFGAVSIYEEANFCCFITTSVVQSFSMYSGKIPWQMPQRIVNIIVPAPTAQKTSAAVSPNSAFPVMLMLFMLIHG